MLQIKNVSKVYKMLKHDVKALNDVSFKLKGNQLVTVVGASGSGKTTLMNIIGSLDSDFTGDVLINSKSLKEAKNKDLDSYRKNTIGFVFQNFSLVNSLTSIQNVELALELSNVNKEEKKKRAVELLTKLGLKDQLNKKVNKLSGGQKQRVAIARALANNPDIILADEPTGALDSKTGFQVMEELKKLSKEKLVLVITHSEDISEKFADTIIKMEDGKIVEIESKSIDDEVEELEEENENIDVGTLSEDNTKEQEGIKEDVGIEIVSIQESKIRSKSKMSFIKAARHTLRNLMLKKGRTFATAIGLSIGIVGIGLSISLTTGTSNLVEEQIKKIFPVNSITVGLKAKPMDTGVKISINGNSDQPQFTYAELQEILNVSNQIVGYEAVPLEVMAQATTASLNKEELISDNNMMLSTRGRVTAYIVETIEEDLYLGDFPAKDKFNEILISLNTAETLLGESKNYNELLDKPIYVQYVLIDTSTYETIYYTAEYTIKGITATNQMGMSIYTNSGTDINIIESEFKIKKEDMKFISVTVYSNVEVQDVKGFIQEINGKQDKYEFFGTSDTIIKAVNDVFNQVRNGLIGFSSVSVIVAILLIYIVVYISVLERTNEIGILRAIGARKRDVRNMFISESMIIGTLSGIIAVLIVKLSCFVINLSATIAVSGVAEGAGKVSGFKIAVLSLPVSLGLIAFCIVLSAVSGLFPSMYAARLDPVKSLRKK